MYEKYLKIWMIAFGITFAIVLPISAEYVFPEGFVWTPLHPGYQLAMLSFFFSWGLFNFWVARDPLKHLGFIWFTFWACLAHGVVMFFQSIVDPTERMHLLGDIPGLFVYCAGTAYLVFKCAEEQKQAA